MGHLGLNRVRGTVPFRPLVRRMSRPFFFDPGFERYRLIGEHRRSTASGKPRVSEPTVEKVQYFTSSADQTCMALLAGANFNLREMQMSEILRET
jgi:hypothetical protein